MYTIALLAPDVRVMVCTLCVAIFLLNGSSPAMFSAMHAVCGTRRRALAVAVVFCCSNLLGLGLGPVIVGSISDHLATRYGTADGLRYAMTVVLLTLIPAGYFMLRAARHMQADLES
jgi:MFS family permease